jgi:hypothetical protein
MTALLSVTINAANPVFDRRSSETDFILYALEEVKKEVGRNNGFGTGGPPLVQTGTILGMSNAGVPNTSLGSWTYTSGSTTTIP